MATYVDIQVVIDRLRVNYLNLGNVIYVDCDAGVNAAGRGTYALPLKTIDYAISNYVVADRNDLVICWASAGGTFDENVNVAGAVLDVSGAILLGIENPVVNNSNGGATAMMTLTADNVKIFGFYFNDNNPDSAIEIDTANGSEIGCEQYPNTFDGCNDDLYIHDSNDIMCHYNKHMETNGNVYHVKKTFDLTVYKNHSVSTQGATAMWLEGGVSHSHRIEARENTFYMDYGLDVEAGTTQCVFAGNYISGVKDIQDDNPIGTNAYIGNHSRSQMGGFNTVEQDIHNAANQFPFHIGNIFYVDPGVGQDDNGRGTKQMPLATIQYAITNYCAAYNDDLLICWSSTGASFDENVNVFGARLNKASIHVVGIGLPNVVNSNVGATSVFLITADHCSIDGMFVNPLGAYDGIVIQANWCRIGRQGAGNYFYSGTVQVNSVGTYCEMAYNVHWDAGGPGTSAYLVPGNTNVIHHNFMTTLSAGTVCIDFQATGCRNYVYENTLTGYTYGIQTGAGAVGNTCVRNAINCGIPVAELNSPGVNNWDGNTIIGVKTTSVFSYLVGVAELTVFTYGAFDSLLRHIVGSLDISVFTAAKLITVRIYETIAGAGWQKIKEDVYTVGTSPNPHFDYTSFVTNRVTMQLNIAEAGNTAVARQIAVKVDE